MWSLDLFGNKAPCYCFWNVRRIRTFVTFHGIFMGPGYALGEDSVWRIVHGPGTYV